MELITEIIQILIALFTSPAGLSVVAIISAAIMIGLLLLGKYIPSSKFKSIGYSVGAKITAKGNAFKYVNPGIYEGIETTFIGSLKAFIEGLIEGLTSD
jgi:hypothetical protein